MKLRGISGCGHIRRLSLFLILLAPAALYSQGLFAAETRIAAESNADRPAGTILPDQSGQGSVAVPQDAKAAIQHGDDSAYAQRLNAALREGRDVLGEEVLAKGASQETLKDYLRPLFLSTGFTNKTYGVHSLLFGMDGGEPPYLVPVADGGRIASNNITSPEYIEIRLGPDGAERYGEALERLEGPELGDGHYPILRTGYTDKAGTHYRQESFAGHLPGTGNLLAFVSIEADRGKGKADAASVAVNCGKPGAAHLRGSLPGTWSENTLTHRLELPEEAGGTLLLVWSPKEALPDTATIDGQLYSRARQEWKQYWDGCLARGTAFQVPETSVMDMQRNLLIQNLIMRWRYSLGAVVYHGDYFQPESSDTMTTLGQYGYLSEFRDGLDFLIDVSKGEAFYSNWERGEKLSHGAQYYLLTRDRAFVEMNTEKYAGFCETLVRQMENDPNGLPEKQRHCGDIPDVAYCTFHQTVCWRGIRDMAEVWGLNGREDLRDKYLAAAGRLRDAITRALDKSESALPDGTLFVPSILLDEKKEVYDPVTKTRMGSYWNLCMPYAFSSGFWPANSRNMDRITGFMRNHGSLMLGLVRFNYYPAEIGDCRADGLPGYSTTGFDNVYLPGYIRMMADRDEADLLGLSFYAKAVHAQTRGTYVSGEGETVGVRPDQFHRSCYGTPCSANNTAFLMALRLMLVRESFDDASGLPQGLYLAHGTPRQWLEPGKSIVVDRAPTCFGPVSCSIESMLDRGMVKVRAMLPDRDRASTIKLKLRVPKAVPITAVTLNGQPHGSFDSASETIDLSGLQGEVVLVVHYNVGTREP